MAALDQPDRSDRQPDRSGQAVEVLAAGEKGRPRLGRSRRRVAGPLALFPFVQFELAGSFGIADGRYPVREAGAEGAGHAETPLVLVLETYGAPAPGRRRLRKAKPREAGDSGDAVIPVTRLTVVDAGEIAGDPDAWLARIRKDEESRDALVDRALACARRAVAAQRVAAADGSLADPSLDGAVVVRVGFGDGDELVEGRWDGAIELPREARRRTRREAIRPQERMAAFLGGRDTPLACEELLIRARADLDGGRERQAALQLRVGLEALLAERERLSGAGQADDVMFLDGRRKLTGETANEALKGTLTPERTAEVEETLAVCERVLRRRAAHG